MSKKRSPQVIRLILVGFLALGVSLILRSQMVERNVEAAALAQREPARIEVQIDKREISGVTSTPTVEPGTEALVVEVTAIRENNPQHINGIEMTASNFRSEGGTIFVDVCYTIPDNRDWAVKDAVIQLKEKTRKLTGGSLIELVHWPVDGKQKVYDFRKTNPDEIVVDVTASEKNVPHRCDEIYFEKIGSDADLSNISLVVSTIYAHPRETDYCDVNYLANVHQAFAAKNLDIKVQCLSDESIVGLEIVEIPAGLSMDEAQNALSDEDFLIDLHGIRGPWVFDLRSP